MEPQQWIWVEFTLQNIQQEKVKKTTLFGVVGVGTVKKIYKIPGFVLTKPSWDWDLVNYSRPGRVW